MVGRINKVDLGQVALALTLLLEGWGSGSDGNDAVTAVVTGVVDQEVSALHCRLSIAGQGVAWLPFALLCRLLHIVQQTASVIPAFDCLIRRDTTRCEPSGLRPRYDPRTGLSRRKKSDYLF